jgi:hypothetical protein
MKGGNSTPFSFGSDIKEPLHCGAIPSAQQHHRCTCGLGYFQDVARGAGQLDLHREHGMRYVGPMFFLL